MFYLFDKNTLEYKRIDLRFTVPLFTILIGLFALGMTQDDPVQPEEPRAESVPVVIDGSAEFSEQALWDLLNDLNVRFPHIVVAQARVESGHFKSKIFLENNNLFGMKVAYQRCTTNKGQLNGHARYDTWQESVIDYAMYQTSYMRKARTEDEYFEALGACYAEDGNYVELVSGHAEDVAYTYETMAGL